MITLSRNLRIAETRIEASRQYAQKLLLEITDLKAKNENLEYDNRQFAKTVDSLRLLGGGRFKYTAKDLKAGMEVMHQTNVESRILTQRPDGKFELLLLNSAGSWQSSAMGVADSLADVAKYMNKANYFLKG